MERQFNSLLELASAIPDEAAAIEHFTAIRWKNGAYCPLCGSVKVYHFSDKKTHKCGDCRQRFSIKVGTIFEGTKLPLRTWMLAIWLITSHKKGIASTQLAKDLNITQKSAWFVLHRLREAAKTKSFNAPLKGHVEADETYIGGRETNKKLSKRTPKQHGGKGKAMVVGVVERNGDLRAFHVDGDRTHGAIRKLVTENVAEGSVLITDEHAAYRHLTGFHHFSVNHSKKEYVRDGFIHTNTLEGAWSLLKRQIYGIHHWVSPKHLNMYVSEMTWRYNRRDMEEGERVNALIAGSDGRLTYKALIA
jgi:transposase-like protein